MYRIYQTLMCIGLYAVYLTLTVASEPAACSGSEDARKGWVLDGPAYVYTTPEKRTPVGIVHPGARVTVCAGGDYSKAKRVPVKTRWVNEIYHPDKPYEISGWISPGYITFDDGFRKGTKAIISSVKYAWGDVSYKWKILRAGKLEECHVNTYESMKQKCRTVEWYQNGNNKLLIGDLLLVSDLAGSWCFAQDMMLTGFCDINGIVQVEYRDTLEKDKTKKTISGDIALKLKQIMEKINKESDYIAVFSDDIRLITAKGNILYRDDFRKMEKRKQEEILCSIDNSFNFYKWEAASASPRWVVNMGRRTLTTPPYVEVGNNIVLNYGRIWLRPIGDNNRQLEIFRIFLDDKSGCG